MHQIAIFASGSGSNAQRIAEYFAGHPHVRVGLILTNNPRAGVIDRARQLDIPVVVFTREQFYGPGGVVAQLQFFNIDFVVLAGFLWLVPESLIAAYPDRIVNIHPALLPAYGGKGMYGMKVHEAVVAAGEKASGITIHLIDNEYDRGRIVFQAQCPVTPADTPADVARKVQALEHEHFPPVIEKLVLAQ
ncbi:MAG: Phosphoribosylglycinamide formyltransferase [uncultured Cytophagales bacterium]|uniref:Phosphoribosylglycinamide formyltransferase n=1 Tax=uncultured Cytophagales bacterium TaxID=158755 RepID=A0A6J4IM66_9SPHI|nr:MAG: Phosphoribosylglycinamide formyltransferase [uncultured Cytophagales bacterium]